MLEQDLYILAYQKVIIITFFFFFFFEASWIYLNESPEALLFFFLYET